MVNSSMAQFKIRPSSEEFLKHLHISDHSEKLERARSILLSMGIKDVKPLIVTRKRKTKRNAKAK